MCRAPILGVFLCVVCAYSPLVENPDDIAFRLSLTKDAPVYHMGEPIEFEIAYSSRSEKKYRGSWSSLRPEFIAVVPRLAPTDGTLDLRDLRREGGFAGSFLSADGYLGPQPYTQKADLVDWYRFQKPGHYSLSFTSKQVSRLKRAEEGGGLEQLTLESNSVEFDILPPDPSWDALEVSTISQALDKPDTPENHGERMLALHRLTLIDTHASAQKRIQLFLSSADWAEEHYTSSRSLLESSHIDLIFPMLEAAISDPSVNPAMGLAGLLAELQVRKQLGAPPMHPDEPSKQQAWLDEFNKRSKIRSEYLERANARILASIKYRSGPQRSAAIYQAWLNAEYQNSAKPPAPGILAQLRLDVLASAQDLQPARQFQFLTLAWKGMPHNQLLPVIRLLYSENSAEDSASRNEMFRLWCEDWPDDCSAAILSDALKSDSQIPAYLVLLLSEEEHSELDHTLEEQLSQPGMLQDSQHSQRTAALILRAGSRNLLPSVDELLAQLKAGRDYNCEIRGYLMGYLFRFAPKDGERRLATDLWETKDVCGSQLFRILDRARYSDELIPAAIYALNSPNLAAAGTAALFLGERAPASAQEALWRRLEGLWTQWSERASELSVTSLENGNREQSAVLEQHLASALSHAKNWKLSGPELERLRAGCLTEKCRNIADGKMSFGL